jgi:hypothetical protein
MDVWRMMEDNKVDKYSIGRTKDDANESSYVRMVIVIADPEQGNKKIDWTVAHERGCPFIA